MTTRLKVTIMCFLLGVLLLACGGGSHSTPQNHPGTTGHSAIGFNVVPGQHMSRVSQPAQHAMNWSLVPVANAQVPTAAFVASSSINAVCETSPAAVLGVTEILTYGAGRWDSAICENNTGVPFGFIPGRQGDFLPQVDGAPIDVAGTAFQLNVHVNPHSVIGAGSGQVNMYVNRAGVITQLPLTCVLGGANKCSDNGNQTGHTFAFQVDDQVFVTVVLQPGELLRNFRVTVLIA